MIKYQVFIAFFLIFIVKNIYSQDIITLKNGKEIESKVLEIHVDEIIYIKQSNIDGPTYRIKKEEVFMIKYENGEKDVFSDSTSKNIQTSNEINKYLRMEDKLFGSKYYAGNQIISKRKFVNLIESNPAAYNQYHLGKTLNITALLIGLPAAVVFGVNIGRWLRGDTPNGAVLAVSGLCWGGAVILEIVGNAKVRHAIDKYNTSSNLGLNLKINENGLGLALQF